MNQILPQRRWDAEERKNLKSETGDIFARE